MSKDNQTMIAPSILSADFGKLAEEIKDIDQGGCDLVHVDVMDGAFVPNLTIGPLVVKACRKATQKPLDVHLMIDEPIRYIEDFRKAGADWITIHVEATDKVAQTLQLIKKSGAKVGISVKPNTAIQTLDPYLEELDLVLVMTVEPGFGGQKFMPEMMDKVKALKANPKFKGLVSVDGGINTETVKTAHEAGADILVAGTAVFGHENRAKAILSLRNK